MPDLIAFLPESAWKGTPSDKQRTVAVPAARILETNYPRIAFSLLCDLLPGCIRRSSDAPEWIPLPADRVALAYKLENRSEVLTVPPPAAINTIPTAPLPAWKRVPKPVLAPVPAPPPVLVPEVKAEAPKSPPAFALFQISAASEPRLKDLFGTDAFLSVQGLVRASASLPGVKACLLRRNDDCVKAGDIDAGAGLPRLTGELFEAVRKFGALFGLKVKQTLTFHSEAGPVSVLRHRGLILVVLHHDGDLVPGTRARLKMVLRAIAGAVPQED